MKISGYTVNGAASREKGVGDKVENTV